MDDPNANSFYNEVTTATKAIQLCASLTNHLQTTTLAQQQNSSSSDYHIQKADFSPVTIGDFAVQALLTSTLHAAFPTDIFLAEESAHDLRSNAALLDHVWGLITSLRPAFTSAGLTVPADKEDLLQLIDQGGLNQESAKGRVWVFDPIDGTATFLRGQQYAINCALLVDGVEQVGLIGCPNVRPDAAEIREELGREVERNGVVICAVRGLGAWVRPLKVLPSSTFSASVQGEEASSSPSTSALTLAPAKRIPRHGDSRKINELVWTDCATYTSTILMLHQQVASKLDTPWPGVDLFSSLMKYAALGLGHASVCIRIFKYASWRSNMWDHAGGVLIFKEAGGRVTDLDGNGINFSRGRKMADNFGLVCAPSSVHAEVLAVVQGVIKEHGTIPWSRET